ncbi:MAG: CMD domain-containing protein [Alphaproteobacteria bacterium]
MTKAAKVDIKSHIVTRMAQLSPGDETYEALAGRANILTMIDQAMTAVTKPKETGGFSHAQRAALACRIARINNNDALADHFYEYVDEPKIQRICDPAYDGIGDDRLAAVLSFTDIVSAHPKDATKTDIDTLRDAGIAEADIVRLAELNAFMAFLIRVVDGLILMKGTP